MNHDELVAAYTAPGRHYHNLAHIEDCLAALARVDNLSAVEREILIAGDLVARCRLRRDQGGQRRAQRAVG